MNTPRLDGDPVLAGGPELIIVYVHATRRG
jgi:hypothetical protein